jgi:hypothetical protein
MLLYKKVPATAAADSAQLLLAVGGIALAAAVSFCACVSPQQKELGLQVRDVHTLLVLVLACGSDSQQQLQHTALHKGPSRSCC